MGKSNWTIAASFTVNATWVSFVNKGGFISFQRALLHAGVTSTGIKKKKKSNNLQLDT